jgi:glycosyltransferase involved in cell wall biosynthesis
MKRKIAIINQRYGLEVNGGSELLTREWAERLNTIYDVEVLTTCALEYTTWEDYYPEGLQKVNGISVRRFPVDTIRNQKEFDEIGAKVLGSQKGNVTLEEEWIDKQGPHCDKLIAYLQEHKDDYDIFLYFTYLYYLTARGLIQVKEKAILVPTAHDEPFIYFKPYRDVFLHPQAIIYITEEERDLVHSIFKNESIPHEVVRTGIELPTQVFSVDFKKKYGLDQYLLYVGRIDEGKNCGELFDYFIQYKKENPSDLKLVLMGKAVMIVPTHPDIISLGFVRDEDKYNGMAGARLLVLPSLYESLSLVVLESLGLGVPVLVNGACTVLEGHCKKSNAGLYYKNYAEFFGSIQYLEKNRNVYEKMKSNGAIYVNENYSWETVIDKIDKIIQGVLDC